MTTSNTTASSGKFWALVPVVLLAGLVSIQLVLVRAALHDPSFSIESGYYSKAVAWDQKRAQDADNARLGWKLNVLWSEQPKGETEFVLTPTDFSGAPISGARVDLEAFSVARAASVLHASFVEGPGAKYTARLRTLRSGLWELSIRVKRGADTFTTTQRLDLPGEGARP